MYLAALILLDASVLLIGVPVAAVLSFLIIRAILKRADAPESIRKVGTFYLAAVIAMFSCALGLFIKDAASPFCQVFVIGAFLFMVSDLLLVFALFVPGSPKCLRAVNLGCYYIGQLLIALSLLLVGVA